MAETDIFNGKISVLYESSSLWSEEDLNNTKNKLGKLSKMTNLNFFIKSEDFDRLMDNPNKKTYIRLVIDERYKELHLTDLERNDSMSISDSPGRNKISSSKSSENIKERRSKKSRRSIKSQENLLYHKKSLKIKSKSYLTYYMKDEEKHSVFLCRMKDETIYCNFVNDEDIKGSKFSELLTYESMDIEIGNKKIIVNSRDIKNLSFPIYFILQNHELTIDDFVCIIQTILESI